MNPTHAPSIYAEQPLFGDFFEPVNTLTNLFFFVAAWCIWKHMRRNTVNTLAAKIYLALVLCIGLGSTAWHFHQTQVTGLMDVVPILLLIILGAHQMVRLLVPGRWPALGTTAAIMTLIPVSGWLLPALGLPSGWYAVLPPLGVLSTLIAVRGGNRKWAMLLPLGIFLLSLTFRQLDHQAASVIPFGTHFLWHFLNSLVLYTMYRAFAGGETPLSSPSET